MLFVSVICVDCHLDLALALQHRNVVNNAYCPSAAAVPVVLIFLTSLFNPPKDHGMPFVGTSLQTCWRHIICFALQSLLKSCPLH